MKIFKKLTLILMSLVMLVTSTTLSNVYAANHNVTEDFDTSWKLKGDMWGPGTILYIDGDIAFCLDSLKEAAVGSNNKVSPESIGLSNKQIDELALIAWYGYRSKRNPTKTDYFLTQNLIWEYLGTPRNYASNSTYPTKESMRSKLDAIMKKVNTFTDTPSFHGKSYTVKAGETLELTDTKKVLSDLNLKNVVGANVEHKGNTLKITPDGSKEKVIIGFDRGMSIEQTKTNFVVRSGGSQPVSKCLSGQDPYNATVFINVEQLGTLKIAKKDSDGNYVPNTTFLTSYNADMSGETWKYTTGEDGTVTIPNWKVGKVYIQEIKVADHLVLDPAIHEVNIEANKTTTYTATNQWKTGELKIAKKDPDGNYVPNTTFLTSYNADMGAPNWEYTTGEDGTVTIPNWKVGKVYIQEIKVNDSLVLDPTIHKVDIVEGKTTTYTVTNQWKPGTLKIAKKDPDGNYVPNTKFLTSYNADMSAPNWEYTTGEDGTVTIPNWKVGKVYIQEVKVDDHLALDKTIREVDITANKTTIYTATNQWAKESLTLKKLDPDGNPVPNVTFRTSYSKDMSAPNWEYTTGEDGTVTDSGWRVGQVVYIQEISVPEHLKLDSTIYEHTMKKINPGEDENCYTAVNDFETGDFKIVKTDSDGNYVEGVTFKLSYNSNMSDPIGTYTTGSNGSILIENLDSKKIYIQEISVPDYLLLDTAIHEKTIKPKDTVILNITNQIKSEYKKEIHVSKIVTGNASNKRKNFKFIIELSDKSINGEYGDVEFINGRGEFYLKDGLSISIINLSKGIDYMISEETYDDYSTYVKLSTDNQWINNSAITGKLDNSVFIEFKNTKEISVDTGINLNSKTYVIASLLALASGLLFIIKKLNDGK